MKHITLFFLVLGLAAIGHAQVGTASVVVPAVVSGVTTILTKGQSPETRAAIVGGSALVGSLVGKKLDSDAARRQFRSYQLGRYQEAWVRAKVDYYNSTLDTRSGLPPAFDGYWAMNLGLPDREKAMNARRAELPPQYVPGDRESYFAYVEANATTSSEDRREQNKEIRVPTAKAVMPARVVNGISYRPTVREFPRLP